jgi:thioesterase domain-containing protein
MATGGPYQMARLAAYFREVRPVMTVSLSGFSPEESLPTTSEAAIEALAASVLEAADGEPMVIVGYSAGGILARCATLHLEEHHGVVPAGLVMLDSYPVASQLTERDLALMHVMIEKENLLGGFDAARLTTMGRYVDIIPKLNPGPVKARELFIQCMLSATPESGDVSDWQAQPWGDGDVQPVQANHFSMLDTDARVVAQAIEEWVSGF